MKHLRIAVIGSGISGLSAAWLLSKRHEVTLFEADTRLGGHSNTVLWRSPEGPVAVDTGFIVYNPPAYPNLTALFEYLRVPTAPARMGFSVSLDGGRVEYAGRGLSQIMGAPRNLADPAHWRMLAGILRFFRTAEAHAEMLPGDLPLRAYLEREGYGEAFITRHLLPMAGAIWSSAPRQMLDYPARAFLRFFANHGLLQVRNRPQWRTVAGGSREYVRRLAADGAMTIIAGQRAIRLMRGDGVTVHFDGGGAGHFDQAVVATHADQALALLDAPSREERELLSAFRYSDNLAVLHHDSALMPRRRRLWSSWNYMGGQTDAGCSVTYWMNALQPLATPRDVFVSLNPAAEPESSKIVSRHRYAHPIFDLKAGEAQRRLWALQGKRNTWYCGAHFGAGFHEDGLQAGLAVAEALGGVERPWRVSNPSGRIHSWPVAMTDARPILEAAE